MATAQQALEDLWRGSTTATFGEEDKKAFHEYEATDYDRTFDCDGCEEIQFINEQGETLLRKRGSGHITLPAGIRVVARRGSTKCL